MPVGEIRAVYAVLPNGDQIVRYSRSKRWFREDASGRRIKRYRRVSDAAREAVFESGDVFHDQPEGTYFDKYTRGMYDGREVPNMQRYTEAGLRREIRYAQARWRSQQKKHQYYGGFQSYQGYRDRYPIGYYLYDYYDRQMIAITGGKYEGTPPIIRKQFKGKKASDVA